MIPVFILVLFTIHIIPIETIKISSLHICDQFYEINNCYYFACIDSIYQCGRYNILVQFSYSLCEATLEQTYKSLTRPGQLWASASQTCLIQELNYFLKNNPLLTCTEIDRFMLNKYPVCLTQSHPIYSLCSVVCNNLDIFFHIFENWNLKSINLKRLLLETAHLCQEKSQMEYVIDIEQSNMRTIFWSLCLDSFKTKFINFDPNEVMIKITESTGMFANSNDAES